MFARLRLVLAAVATLAVLALLVVPGMVTPATAEIAPAADDHALVSESTPAASRRAPAHTTPRPRLLAAVLAVVGLVAGAVAVAPHHGLVGRRRRRTGDDGERWRSLLLHAPPAPA